MGIDCLSAGILVADHLCPPISHVPEAGELILCDELPLAIGGCASNVAIDLARLGFGAGVIGCVGDDAFGKFIVDTLQRSGVQTAGIREIRGVGTSATLIINVEGQDRRFIHTKGANAALKASDITLERLQQAKVLYVGGYLLLSATDQDELCEVFAKARSLGVRTVLDVVLPGEGDHWSQLERVLSETDLFLPNVDEAAAITGLDDPLKQAEKFRAAGAGTVVITCGDEGTILIGEDDRLKASIYTVPYVGATGAGDAFDAGYIAGMIEGGDARRCLEWGSALGASCVRAVGATESVFDRTQLEAFLRDERLQIESL